MLPPWVLRFVPAVIAVGLLTFHAFRPDWLGTRIVTWLPLTWFWVVTLPVLYFAAWCITPSVVRFINRVGRRAFLPPLLILAFIVGAAFFVDVLYNATIATWFDVPRSRIIDTMKLAFGGT